MDHVEGNLYEVIKEELNRLGIQSSYSVVQNEIKKSSFYQNGSKLFWLSGNYTSKSKNKNIFTDSPKIERKFSSQGECPKTPKFDYKIRKTNSKSPFSSKQKMERKSVRVRNPNCGTNMTEKVFGCDLEAMELCPVHLQDGALVAVPQFVVDVCSLIRKNISIEGIFRKAGSTQRQNEIKVLMKSGVSLPSTVHPVDAACLLKQFLRQLPSPLISHHVHFLMTRCLELPKEEQLEALRLCSLLLPKHNQDLLAYILEVLSVVASSSKINLMDAHNLAIVLAPNLLPIPKNNTGKKNVWISEDQLLSLTIDVIKLLIEGAGEVCRLSEKLSVAVKNRERSLSVENLTEAPTSSNSKKKRRSASIHRLVNGIRRVVQGGSHTQAHNVPSSPLKNVATPPFHRGEEALMNFVSSVEDRPIKKPRVELKAAKPDVLVKELPVRPPNRKISSSRSSRSVGTSNEESVERRYSLREKAKHPDKTSFSNEKGLERRKTFVGVGVARRTSLKASCETPNLILSRKGVSPRLSRRHASQNSCSESSEMVKPVENTECTESMDWRPVGSECEILGPRGIPDGAETDIRNSPMVKVPHSSVQDLEKTYDEIKFAVENMGDKIDSENLRDLKNNFLSSHSSDDVSSINCAQLICNAYERMKAELKDLDTSPEENLSRRLGRELRIRSRRSDEHRVFRSPSERKIGTIRRRSKELEQQLSKMQGESTENKVPSTTPKLKGILLQSPQVALRRGKPNTVKSGLPLVIKPSGDSCGHEQKLPETTPSKRVCVQKRRLSSSNNNNHSISPRGSLGKTTASTYSGPMTRRRSSVMSTASNPLPCSNLPSAESSFDLSFKSLSESRCKKDPGNSEESSYLRGCSLLLTTSGKDLSGEEGEWVSATSFMDDVKNDTTNVSGNRPSIAALKEQKKVTANVQLFSQLQDRFGGSPSTRRSSRHRQTPNSHLPLRPVNSECLGSKSRTIVRSPLTPINIRHIPINKATSCSSSPSSHIKRKHANEHLISDFEISTPKIMRKEEKVSKVRRTNTFVIPSGLTPLPPRLFKPPHLNTPKRANSCCDTPPNIPPKSISLSSKNSLVRNYR